MVDYLAQVINEKYFLITAWLCLAFFQDRHNPWIMVNFITWSLKPIEIYCLCTYYLQCCFGFFSWWYSAVGFLKSRQRDLKISQINFSEKNHKNRHFLKNEKNTFQDMCHLLFKVLEFERGQKPKRAKMKGHDWWHWLLKQGRCI